MTWLPPPAEVGFDCIHEAEAENCAFIVYEAHTSTGKRFRNSEVITVRDGKLLETEVYFSWGLPHQVPQGEHVDNEGQGHA